MSTKLIFKLIPSTTIILLFLVDNLNGRPGIKINKTSRDANFLLKSCDQDEPQKVTDGSDTNKIHVMNFRSPPLLDSETIKGPSDKLEARETENSTPPTSWLSWMTSNAKNLMVSTVSSIVNPIDEVTKKAVNGISLVMGVANGLASNAGTQAFNSLARVHNTNVDNLIKLKSLTRNVGHSAVDLGSTMVTETVHVLNTVRKENNRLLGKVTRNIPIVRNLVSLNNVVGLAIKCVIISCVRGAKHLGDLTVDALTLTKAKELNETSGGLKGCLEKASRLSPSQLITLCLAIGKGTGYQGIFGKFVDLTKPGSAFKTGQALVSRK